MSVFKIFKGCTSLKTIIIPSSVVSIAAYSFENSKSLENVYCYASDVPDTKSSSFKKTYANKATLHVPGTSIEAYKAKEPWMWFFNIVAITDTDPKPTAIDQPLNNVIEKNLWYTLTGRKIEGKPTSKGLYIHNGKKVILK